MHSPVPISIDGDSFTGRLVSSTPHTQQIILRPTADTVIVTLQLHNHKGQQPHRSHQPNWPARVSAGASPIHSAHCQPGSLAWHNHDLIVSTLNTSVASCCPRLKSKPWNAKASGVWRLPASASWVPPQPHRALLLLALVFQGFGIYHSSFQICSKW